MTKISKNFQSATDDPNALLNFLGDPAWVKHCRPEKAKDGSGWHHSHALPAGVTYLSQLMAHDMFLTEPCRNTFVPNTSPRADQSRVNLVQHPLMLETVYGRTGAADSVLYDQENPDLFDVFAYERYTKAKTVLKFLRDPRRDWSYPTTADARNFSSPMLAQITLKFMIYHNRLVNHFDSIGHPQDKLFALARGTVIRTWHNILQHDILETTCRKTAAARFPSWMRKMGLWSDKEVLSRDILRCFHALVREDYLFNKLAKDKDVREPIRDILSIDILGPKITVSKSIDTIGLVQKKLIGDWLSKWEVDWNFFFDDKPKGGQTAWALNRTGFTPSFTFSRPTRDVEVPIQIRDAEKSTRLITSEFFEYAKLSPHIKDLMSELEQVNGPCKLGGHVSIPFAVALLAESFYSTPGAADRGKLGHLGSALVRRQIEPVIAQAATRANKILAWAKITAVPEPDVLPKTFTQMIGLPDLNFVTKGA